MNRRIHWFAAIVMAAAPSLHAQTGAGTSPASSAAQLLTNAPPPKPKWESTLNAGLTLTRGNSETLTASGEATTQKKWDDNELKFGVDGTYGESKVGTNDTVNANMIHGYGQYNRLFTKRWYAYARAEALHDEIADVHYRVTLGPGAGYYLVKRPSTELSLEVGPGYILQKQGASENNFATMRVAENFTQKISNRAKLWEKAEYLPKLEDTRYFIVNDEVGLSAALTSDNKLSLTVTLDHTYNSEPASGRLKNDTLLKTGITYAF